MKKRLTDEGICKLRTTKKQEDIFHTRTPSAGIRLSREGRRTFFLLYRSPTVPGKDGKPMLRRFYFGEHTSGKLGEPRYLTLKQFETDFSILRGKLAQGIDPQEVTAQETGVAPRLIPAKSLPEDLQDLYPGGTVEGTVGSLLCDFLTDAKSRLRPHTYQNYRVIVRTHLLPRHGRTPLALMGEEDVRALLSEIARDRKAPKLAREVRKVLSCAFAWGKAHVQGVKVNPTQGVKLTGARGRRDRWLTDAELVTLFRTLPQLEDAIAADLYLLVLSSLCRPGEAFSMRAEDVTTINGERVWKLSDTKNGRDFLIPLQGVVEEVVSRRMAAVGGQGYLFWKYSAQHQTYPQQLTRATKQFRELSGLGDVNPHDLRRTGRTHLSSLGVREEVAEAVLNHAKEDLKATYNLYGYWAERKAALVLWHGKLSALRLEALGASRLDRGELRLIPTASSPWVLGGHQSTECR